MNPIHTLEVLFRTARIRILHRLFNVRIMPGVYDVHLDTRIYGKNGYVSLGKRTKTSRNVVLVAVDGYIEIGDHCSFSGGCTVVAHEKVMIGDNCMFGPGVKVYDHDHIFDEFGVQPDGYKTAAITIGSRTWVGANAIILKGTNIGEGCVIGAGTIVKGSIPPHSLVTNERELVVKPIRK